MKNIKHIWSVLCSNSSIDQTSNTVSLFNIIEELEVQVPASVQKTKEPINLGFNFDLVTLWKREGGILAYDQKVELLSPNMDSLSMIEAPVNFTDKSKRARINLKIQGITLIGEGEYLFRVSVKEKSEKKFEFVHEVPFQVKIKSSD